MMKIKQDIAEMGAEKKICLLFSFVSLRSCAYFHSKQSQRIFRKPKMFVLIGNTRKSRLILY